MPAVKGTGGGGGRGVVTCFRGRLGSPRCQCTYPLCVDRAPPKPLGDRDRVGDHPHPSTTQSNAQLTFASSCPGHTHTHIHIHTHTHTHTKPGMDHIHTHGWRPTYIHKWSLSIPYTHTHSHRTIHLNTDIKTHICATALIAMA